MSWCGYSFRLRELSRSNQSDDPEAVESGYVLPSVRGCVFPGLRLEDWRSTRDSLHDFSRVLGSLRRDLTPYRQHWWHITLHVGVRGLTTTPIPAGTRSLELVLNPMKRQVELNTSIGEHVLIQLQGLSQRALADRLNDELRMLAIDAPSLLAAKWNDGVHDYDSVAASRYWQALAQVDGLFREFKGNIKDRTGPGQLFPHHFDLSMNWFSGRFVPGVDSDDEESTDEQLNFGFVTGDAVVDDAYFYVTAYPSPDGITEIDLPDGAYWHTDGFTGALLSYDTLAESENAGTRLLEFFRTVKVAGSKLMD